MKNMRIPFVLFCLISVSALAQRDRQGQTPANGHDHANHVDENEFAHNHLDHIQAYRKETAYVHNLPPAQFLDGIGTSTLKMTTKSEQAQKYFAQGVALLHD